MTYQCPFEILRLPTTATLSEIYAQWRQLVFQTHPDRNADAQATEQTMILNNAKDEAVQICNMMKINPGWVKEHRRRREKEAERAKEEQRQADRAKQDGKKEKAVKRRKENKRRKDEERKLRIGLAKPIYDTICMFMAQHSDIEDKVFLTVRTEIDSAREAKSGDTASAVFRAVYGMAETLNAERKNANQRLAELTAELDQARREGGDLKTKLREAELAADQRRDCPGEIVDEPTTHKRKRTMVPASEEMVCKINTFLAQHLKISEGGFVASRTIQIEFEKEHSNQNSDVFRKYVKKFISETFVEWSCSRKICSETKEKQQGYKSLCFE